MESYADEGEHLDPSLAYDGILPLQKFMCVCEPHVARRHRQTIPHTHIRAHTPHVSRLYVRLHCDLIVCQSRLVYRELITRTDHIARLSFVFVDDG